MYSVTVTTKIKIKQIKNSIKSTAENELKLIDNIKPVTLGNLG